jgi:hypothetical protein
MLPLLLAMDATKKGMLAFVQQMGMVVLSELLASEAEELAGKKGRHATDRTHNHWGTARSQLTFGGRSVSIERPQVAATPASVGATSTACSATRSGFKRPRRRSISSWPSKPT